MNKKVVVLAVFLECILAVLLVSFFGKMIEDLRDSILCEEICFTYETGEKIEDGTLLKVSLSPTKRSYQLHWTIDPSNASNKEVEFISSKPEYVVIDETGLVTFFVDVDVIVTVRTLDGSGRTDSITLVPAFNTDVEI